MANEPLRIAVLAFESSGEPADASLAAGLTDEVRSRLASMRRLEVVARASSLNVGHRRDPVVVARELGARFLLSGDVRRAEGEGASRLEVAARLVEVAPDGAVSTRWQRERDAGPRKLLDVQSEIAAEVANALGLQLSPRERELLALRPTSSLDAFDAFLAGRALYDRGSDGATQRAAAVELERAVAIDPRFALAWAYLSVSRTLVHFNGAPSPELAAGSRTAGETALSLASQLPEAYWALGLHARLVEFDTARSLELLERGLELAPSNADLLRNAGWAQFERGRFEEAVATQRRAVKIDPRSWSSYGALSESLLRLHRSEEAREIARRGLAFEPGNMGLVVREVMSFLQTGELEGARASVAKAAGHAEPTTLVAGIVGRDGYSWVLDSPRRELLLRLPPSAFDGDVAIWASALANEHWLRSELDEARRYAEQARTSFSEQLAQASSDPMRWAGLAAVLGLLGEREAAERAAERAETSVPPGSSLGTAAFARHMRAIAEVRLGNRAEAIELLAHLLRERYYLTPDWLRIDPSFESLRSDPRFVRLTGGTGERPADG